jgi:hypothetical protein
MKLKVTELGSATDKTKDLSGNFAWDNFMWDWRRVRHGYG